MTEFTEGCIDGYKNHSFPGRSLICARCGIEKSKVRESSSIKSSTNKKTPTEPSFSKTEAKDGIAMLILASQTIILSQRPNLKEDALNPQERMMLADALADEAYESATIKRFLAKLGQQKKHTKLMMVCMAIAIPRLAKRGLIPQEGMDQLQNELVTASSSSSRPNGNTAGESEPSWESIPVESGGSPFINRGNGIGENDIGGVAPETAPIRGGIENENGRREIPDASSGEVTPLHAESKTESDRDSTGSSTDRPKARRTVRRVPIGW